MPLKQRQADAASSLLWLYPHEALATPERPESGRRKAKRGRKAKPGRGGWPASKYISRDDYREALHCMREIERAGYPLNVLVTVSPPPDLSDKDAKRFVSRKFAHLGQSLERRGQPSIGVTVYEKKAGGALHGHSHFIHKDNMEVIERFADRFDRLGGDRRTRARASRYTPA